VDVFVYEGAEEVSVARRRGRCLWFDGLREVSEIDHDRLDDPFRPSSASVVWLRSSLWLIDGSGLFVR
jgi:hypothetical protein